MAQLNKLLADKNWKELVSNGEIALNRNPDNIDIYIKLAIGYRHLNKLSKSRKILYKGLEIAPKHSSLLIEIAALENEQHNWKAAVLSWEKAKDQSHLFSDLNYQRYSKALILQNEENILAHNISFKAELTSKTAKDNKLKAFLIKELKLRINEIRNIDKNKPLSLQYTESSCKLLHSRELDKELAISYMHSHKWQQATLKFEELVQESSDIFDVYDFNRLLKCYEMQNQFENYESIALEGLRAFPADTNIPYRLIYYSLINSLHSKKFETALKKINLLLGTRMPAFWGLDKNQLLSFRNKCLENTSTITSVKATSLRLSVIANRADGLGERLNALLNAIVIAKTFNYKFGYNWKDQVHANHLQESANKNKNLIGHAIVTESDFFDLSFISNYSVTNINLKKYKTISGDNHTYESLYKLESDHRLNGWFSPRLELKDHFSKELLIDSIYSYKEAFSFIRFNKPISKSIELAKTVMKGQNFIAIHLRSGDVFYGEYRKFLHYTYKGIVLPLAKSLIKNYLNKNNKVIVFGQDKVILSYLKKKIRYHYC